VLAAMPGGVALDLAGQHRPDVILPDLNLPDMTGEVVLAELRANPATGDIPVVILSADATERRADQARSEGVQAYLTKPIDCRACSRRWTASWTRRPGRPRHRPAEAAMAWRSMPPSRPAQ
jgi:CheY-like chemotaxis protein